MRSAQWPSRPRRRQPNGAAPWATSRSRALVQRSAGGPYAYVTAGYQGVHVIDVHNPARPTAVRTLALAGYARAIVARAATRTSPIDRGLRVLTLADPAAPRKSRSIPCRGTLSLSRWAAATPTCPMGAVAAILDVADPARPGRYAAAVTLWTSPWSDGSLRPGVAPSALLNCSTT